MAPHRRRNVVARRRRLEDEGEDDGSIGGELEDDSLSEGSVISNPDEDADGEGSEASDNDETASLHGENGNKSAQQQPNGKGKDVRGKRGAEQPRKVQLNYKPSSPVKESFVKSAAGDTEAMKNGLKLPDGAEGNAEIHFEDMKDDSDVDAASVQPAQSKENRRETFAERKRREHEAYIKQRDENPAFVPTRGGFFLHDKRSEQGSNGYRPFNKVKSKPFGLIVDSSMGRRQSQKPDATAEPWTHDLHETVARDERQPSNISAASQAAPVAGNFRTVPTAPRSSPPNRSFSTTVLIGNVPVVVSLPGMENPISFSAVPKKQHTRLPQHRPPLRRDKPVRISLPGQPPRYIFPATERSFIFIPRAMRPNQQAFRGRGRGGFYGSRRTSVYGGSNYTPSVAMSRRSSLGRAASREGVHSPAGSVMSRQAAGAGDSGKPVVRLPPAARQPLGVVPYPAPVPANMAPNATLPQPLPYPPPQHPAFRESQAGPIPMHQPRPQKTVSVADIESPAILSFNPPPQQQEQPFHQQVPVQYNGQGYPQDGPSYPPHARHVSHPSQASGTPLSQIPERAIHAQPFQPYPAQQPQGFYPSAYPAGGVVYPMPGAEYPGYNPASTPGGPVAAFVPAGNQPYIMAPPAAANEQSGQSGQPGTVAHESNGTVYFYDTSQLYPPGGTPQYGNPPFSVPPQGGVVGMGGMMTPPGTTYYYPQPQGGVYYPSQ